MSMSVSGLQSLNSDAFLKLFVTQMQHQDPTEPMDPNQLMSELAQFTSVQKLTEMNDSFSGLLRAESLGEARGVIGQEVTYSSATGDQASGVVAAAEIQDNVVGVMVGGEFVSLDAITAIRPVFSAA